MLVEHYARHNAHQWLLTVLGNPDDVLALNSIDCRIPLSDIYERVEFEAAGQPSSEPAP